MLTDIPEFRRLDDSVNSVCSIKYLEHEEIERQTQEFLKRGKITECAPGLSSEFLTSEQIAAKDRHDGWQKSNRRIAGEGVKFSEPAHIRRNKTKAKSGHQNISCHINKVYFSIGGRIIKIFDINGNLENTKAEAVRYRDDYRKKNGLPKADY